MKTTITVLALLALSLASCKKDEVATLDCKCGEVTKGFRGQNQLNGSWYHQLTIKNNCSQSDTLYDSSEQEYRNYTVGSTYCFPNSTW